ncbi:ABC transporter permease subunit [Halorubrum gandharaense]
MEDPDADRSDADRPAAWLSIARYEAAGRTRGAAVLTALLSAFLLVFLAFFPTMEESGVDFDEYVQALPPAMREAFGIITMSTIEGFLAVEFYQFGWVILVGLYLAYLGGETVAGDVERGRMDLTLSAPVRRRSVVVGKFLGLVPLILLLNIVVPVVAYAGVVGIGESIAAERILAAHLLAVPYHLACAALGVAISTFSSRASVAQRVALGSVFLLFMFESIVGVTEYDELGLVSPTAHYTPSEILVQGTYDATGAAVLLAATVVLVTLAAVRFSRADLDG